MILANHAPSLVRDHFCTAEQQRDTEVIGMWIFLATEVLFFGGVFTAFTVYRMYYWQAFGAGSADMNILLGSINTAVLITSSLTMALAVHSSEAGNRRLLVLFLILTMILGCISWVSNSPNTTSIIWNIRCLRCGSNTPGRMHPKCKCFSFSTTS